MSKCLLLIQEFFFVLSAEGLELGLTYNKYYCQEFKVSIK